jgi:N-acetylglucosaminyldiphosphoundecaprenol N-acetyl-beta-D-mannosaminyltransferase
MCFMRGAGALARRFEEDHAPARFDGRVEIDTSDLARDVYCVLGMPVDATDMVATLAKIAEASEKGQSTLISTANLNFLTNALANPEFRESLLRSDFCTADGMPIVWLARLLGLPIRDRVSGADILDKLRTKSGRRKLRVFFFGGADGIATAARRILNAENGGITCVGTLNPGYGTIEDMSGDAVIAAINASNADFLVVALGAAKGQAWLLRNHHHLRIPLRAHLGAALNFQAGSLRRAPRILRVAGLEWLWRIKEEPHLWTRYWRDGQNLLRLLWSHVLPLAYGAWLQRRQPQELRVRIQADEDSVVLNLAGDATATTVSHANSWFQEALVLARPLVVLDLAAVRYVDQRFLGSLLMLRKSLHRCGATLLLVGASGRLRRLFQLNEVAFLLGDK